MNIRTAVAVTPRRAGVGALTALLSYVLVMGGTWTGIMTRSTVTASILILAGAVGGWLYVRRRDGWRWPRTALDRVLPLWLIAFAVSTLANLDSLPRIGVGLWFSGLYILAWYAIQDARANRALQAGALVDGLLVAAAVLPLGALVDVMLDAERIAGFQGNPNILGALLVMIAPLAAGRTLTAQGSQRYGWAAYLALMALLTWVTGSRGAWLGVLAALGVILMLRMPRAAAMIAVMGVPVVLALFFLRGDTGRSDLYRHALQLFVQAPLTGHGLFTFRLLDTTGQDIMHLHAHNALLHTAAEMGIPGLVALAATLIGLGRAAYRARAATPWPLAALAGVLAHQMVDFPVISPGVALCVVVVLGAAIPPGESRPDSAPQAVFAALLAALLCLSALVVGALPGALI
ncbi:MAG: O-antigen ligase family protein [Anaerolineae bacterium]|nr:O-antigen ligase family protein [Anaerolineae bacterium]